ncbi:L,D-transpeptidase family protein [Petrotoga sp. 9PWA.NaAc.5.4]|uniref:L,D-transpeptidase family protein n=1 Tax=Petrotoga sp. 9PWA.NaAc.5.4 TaxID=1434328 RepID=UPI000CA83BAB|nr:L,D-transpeptidase family protein [Petrotoga sp. 9PWA.NaAc.5.4]PNR94618.1 hypothetical protein X924_06245 [Petrotoga sp. 9PWA.NaAc.5.4]
MLRKILKGISLLLFVIISITIFSENHFFLYLSEYDQSQKTVKINLESYYELSGKPEVYIYDGSTRRKLTIYEFSPKEYFFYVNLNGYNRDFLSFSVSATTNKGEYISDFFNNFLEKKVFSPEIKVEITTSLGELGYEYYLDYEPKDMILTGIRVNNIFFESSDEFLRSLRSLKEGVYNVIFNFKNKYAINFEHEIVFLKIKDIVITENTLKPQQKTEIYGYHIVQKGESIYKIARDYNVLPGDLVNINGLKDPSLIYPGQPLQIGKVEYYESPVHLEIDLSKNKMYLYFHKNLVKTYVVAVGMSDYTPPGYYRISYKEKDPALYWYDEYIPPGSMMNGIGTRWLQLSNPQYGIHGTTKPWEIGKRISHGCIRMFNFDVEEIDFMASLGTEVYVYYGN